MRFAVAHKAATYLMVACAFLAMVGGGEVTPAIAMLGLVGLVLSWWWEPPLIRFERWNIVWTIASLGALAYAVLTAVVTGDFLGVGGEFLIWLTVAKAFNRRAARDWQQLYLLSFLMLVAGSVLDAELAYGACFLGYVIASTWAVTLFHLRREMEENLLVKHAADRASERVEVRRILDSKRIVGAPFFLGTGALSLGVFLASAALFLSLPRVGMGFFFKSRGGLTMSGFSDGVKLGGHGVIKNDDTVVMRAEIDPLWGSRSAPELHWRGVAFDLYRHGQWSRSRNAPDTRRVTDRPGPGRERISLLWDGIARSAEALESNAIRQDIWLEPLDSDVLFGAGAPRVVEVPASIRPHSNPEQKNDELRFEHGGTIHYTVWSDIGPPPVATLRAAHGTIPPNYRVYLELPPEITERTRELARTITAGLTNDYDRADAIHRWLDANLSYTLELVDPGAQEPVDFFLFDRKRGHCEYFASAFAVLARAVGIPTRDVNGFLGGEWNEYEGYVAVRAGDAHSWDEVYFPTVGWVTFDPTPSGGEQLGRGGAGWRARVSRYMDTLRFQWTKWVIEYDLSAQLGLLKDIGGAFKRGAQTAEAALGAIKRAVVEHWPVALTAGALIAGAIAWRRRRRGDRALTATGGRTAPRSTVGDVYHQALRALAKAGMPRDPAVTPRELAAALARRGAPGALALGELTDLYYAAEWGGRRDPVAERRATELVAEIRDEIARARVTGRTRSA